MRNRRPVELGSPRTFVEPGRAFQRDLGALTRRTDSSRLCTAGFAPSRGFSSPHLSFAESPTACASKASWRATPTKTFATWPVASPASMRS